MTRVVHARAAWLPEGLREGVAVVLDEDRVIEVRAARRGDPAPLDGLLVPGLIDAHLHLELCALAGRVPPLGDFVRWGRRLGRVRADIGPDEAREAARGGARQLFEAGTAAVCDVGNEGWTASILAESGLSGIAQHELLTLDRGRLPARLEAAVRPRDAVRWGAARVVARAAPHALFSTAPSLVRACVLEGGPAGVPSTIHVAEDPSERAFLDHAGGPVAEWLDEMGLDWRWWDPPGLGPIGYLDALGVLGPGLLLVHGVHLDGRARRRVAEAGAPLCLCPRSNLHVGGQLPDVPALLADGVRLCLGTDSLASSPDLDVLGEVPVLAAAFPEVPAGTWLDLATRGGADALALDGFGRLAPGGRPGLLQLEVDALEDLTRAPPTRRWIALPGTP